MRTWTGGLWAFAGLLAFAPVAWAEDAPKRPQGPPPAEEIFRHIDTDGDGSISKDEFLRHHKQMIERFRDRRGAGEGARPGREGGPERPDRRKGGRPDGPPRDGEGRPHGPRDGERAQRGPGDRGPGDRGPGDRGPEGHRGPRPGNPEQFFKRMDKNGDGKLTADDFSEQGKEHFERMLKRNDKDGDQAISKDEFMAAARERIERMKERQGSSDARRPGPPKRGPHDAGRPDGPPPGERPNHPGDDDDVRNEGRPDSGRFSPRAWLVAAEFAARGDGDARRHQGPPPGPHGWHGGPPQHGRDWHPGPPHAERGPRSMGELAGRENWDHADQGGSKAERPKRCPHCRQPLPGKKYDAGHKKGHGKHHAHGKKCYGKKCHGEKCYRAKGQGGKCHDGKCHDGKCHHGKRAGKHHGKHHGGKCHGDKCHGKHKSRHQSDAAKRPGQGKQSGPPRHPGAFGGFGPMPALDPAVMIERMAGALDRDKDGKVSYEEFVAAHKKRFEQLDANKDGAIDKAERQAAGEKLAKRIQEAQAKHKERMKQQREKSGKPDEKAKAQKPNADKPKQKPKDKKPKDSKQADAAETLSPSAA